MRINLVVQIVGCRQLQLKKRGEFFVKAVYGRDVVHKTEKIKKVRNLVFSKEMDNIFVLQTTENELHGYDGLILKIKTTGSFGSNLYGEALITPKEILEMRSGRDPEMTFEIAPGNIKPSSAYGSLVVRCHEASVSDLKLFKGRLSEKDLVMLPPVRVKGSQKADFMRPNDIEKDEEDAQTAEMSYQLDTDGPVPEGRRTKRDSSRMSEKVESGDRQEAFIVTKELTPKGESEKEDLPSEGCSVSENYDASAQTLENVEDGVSEKRMTTGISPLTRIRNYSPTIWTDSADLPSDVKLFVQIISCTKLRKRDDQLPNPYLRLKLGDNEVHETIPVMESVNPLYETALRSTCVVHTSVSDLLFFNGLDILVEDWGQSLAYNSLGSVRVTAEELISSGSEPQQLKLIQRMGTKQRSAGFVTVRLVLQDSIPGALESLSTVSSELSLHEFDYSVDKVEEEGRASNQVDVRMREHVKKNENFPFEDNFITPNEQPAEVPQIENSLTEESEIENPQIDNPQIEEGAKEVVERKKAPRRKKRKKKSFLSFLAVKVIV